MLSNPSPKNPIGIFDSGIGGLTVAKSIFEQLPSEDIIYLGDTARLPYGTKSRETVILYSIECVKFLLKRKVKMIIIACNTASSVAIPFLKKITKIPVIGVIEPGATAAAKNTIKDRIGVIGTNGTINSKAYDLNIQKINKKIKVYSQVCSLFVQLAEEGWTDNKITGLICKEYLSPLKNKNIDTVILGCTHYPVLKKPIQKTLGKNIKLIDSGFETAKEVKNILLKKKLSNTKNKKGNHRFFVTDYPNKFQEVSERFLGQKILDVKKIKLN
ncbi:MAG TPA: glutamate racemase [Ignavibacteria bacterium]|nr:glutamate racemase [Ignavibacteria bacterium]